MGNAQGSTTVSDAHLDIYVNDYKLAYEGITEGKLEAYNATLERAFANQGRNAPSINSKTGQKLPIRVNPGEFSFHSSESNGIWRQIKTAGEAAGGYACGGAIPKTFFEKDKILEDIDIVILLRAHTIDAKRVDKVTPATTRSGGQIHTYGFVLLKDLRLSSLQPENFIYTEGLCSNQPGTGMMMMDVVHYLCYQTDWTGGFTSQKLDGAKLSALCYVIPYYFNKFSYRFRGGTGEDRSQGAEICGPLLPSDNTLNSIVPKLPGISSDEESDAGNWMHFKELLQKLGKAHPWSDNLQVQKLFALRDYEYADMDDTRIEEIKNRFGLDDQGYEMYFCMRPDSQPLAGIASQLSGVRPTDYTLTLISEIDSGTIGRERRAAIKGVQQRQQGEAAQKTLHLELAGNIRRIDQGKSVGKSGGKRRRKRQRKKTKKRAPKKRHSQKRKYKRRRRRKTRRRHK